MENLNAEAVKKALECCTKGTCVSCPHFKKVPCQIPLMRDALALITSQEQRIKELTEENERLRGVGLPDYETYIKLSDAKHAIMDYIGEQTVSKYDSSAECKSARGGAEGAMNELDYLIPANVAPIADTVRKMQERVLQLFPCDKKFTTISRFTIDQIAKELLEKT